MCYLLLEVYAISETLSSGIHSFPQLLHRKNPKLLPTTVVSFPFVSPNFHVNTRRLILLRVFLGKEGLAPATLPNAGKSSEPGFTLA